MRSKQESKPFWNVQHHKEKQQQQQQKRENVMNGQTTTKNKIMGEENKNRAKTKE